jgi:hypothetical protein
VLVKSDYREKELDMPFLSNEALQFALRNVKTSLPRVFVLWLLGIPFAVIVWLWAVGFLSDES